MKAWWARVCAWFDCHWNHRDHWVLDHVIKSPCGNGSMYHCQQCGRYILFSPGPC